MNPPVHDVSFFAPKEVSWGPVFPLSSPLYPVRPCRPKGGFGLIYVNAYKPFNGPAPRNAQLSQLDLVVVVFRKW